MDQQEKIPQLDVVWTKWENKYQVFETTSYERGAKVTAGTKFVDIKLGQQATFDNGKVTSEEDQTKPLSVKNGWKEGARVGVRNYDPSTDAYHSFFLSPTVLTDTMTMDITPINKFRIFWHRDFTIDALIDDAIANPYDFEMTGDEITIRYSMNKPRWSRV